MFQDEKQLVVINRVKAGVKDVKVTGKGIQINIENAQLTGSQISEISALVGGMVYIDIEERLPQSRKAENVAEGQLSLEDYENEPEVLSDEEVSEQLGINIESGQNWVKSE